MKLVGCVLISLCLAGCSLLPSPSTPTDLAKGTGQGAWSLKDAETVRNCLGSGTAETRYEVQSLRSGQSVYNSSVSIFSNGALTPAEIQLLARCL